MYLCYIILCDSVTDCAEVEEVHDNGNDPNHSLVHCTCGPRCPSSLSGGGGGEEYTCTSTREGEKVGECGY